MAASLIMINERGFQSCPFSHGTTTSNEIPESDWLQINGVHLERWDTGARCMPRLVAVQPMGILYGMVAKSREPVAYRLVQTRQSHDNIVEAHVHQYGFVSFRSAVPLAIRCARGESRRSRCHRKRRMVRRAIGGDRIISFLYQAVTACRTNGCGRGGNC